jgi:serine/threonine protein kinase
VKAFQSQGAYGAVYQAERVGWRRSEPGALKVSLLLWNARVEREVKLLSRLSHPSIPRLLDRGGSLPPSSAEYPYFVMEWVQGPELYAWAEQHAPSEKQVCRVLAQVARAVEAVHAAGAVHRDVKGANVLVRLLDRRAMLIDFGSCHFQGAQRLTWQALPPVTPDYLSPQAWPVFIRSQFHEEGYYEPSPADDLYALGVMAYRLVMGQYPERIQAKQDEHGRWQATGPDPRPKLESNPRAGPLLREVIVRLLSDEPEARGTAAQVAAALEAGAGEEEASGSARPPVRTRVWKPWLTVAAAGACAVWLWCSQWRHQLPGFSNAQAPDTGTTAVGDTSPTEPEVATPSSEETKPIAQEPLPEPRPWQAQSDEKGRCPGRKQVPMNGGCWEQLSRSVEECVENGYVLFKGKCYLPVPAPPRKPAPTSSPEQAR